MEELEDILCRDAVGKKVTQVWREERKMIDIL